MVGDEIDSVPNIVDDEDIHALTDRSPIFLSHFYGVDAVDHVV